MPKILANARYDSTRELLEPALTHIELPPPTGKAKDTEFFLIRTFWADDDQRN